MYRDYDWSSIPIVVPSCDEYSDAWEPLSTGFQRYWPDCPFPCQMITNYKTTVPQPFQAVPLGNDRGMTGNLLVYLAKHPDIKSIILWVDDLFLIDNVRQATLLDVLGQALRANAGFLLLYRAWYTIANGTPLTADLCTIDPYSRYRGSLSLGLWHCATLQHVLDPALSPWEFEYRSQELTAHLEAPFLCLSPRNDRPPPIKVVNGIRKRRWTYEGIQYLQHLDLGTSDANRPTSGPIRHLTLQLYRALRLAITKAHRLLGWPRPSS